MINIVKITVLCLIIYVFFNQPTQHSWMKLQPETKLSGILVQWLRVSLYQGLISTNGAYIS